MLEVLTLDPKRDETQDKRKPNRVLNRVPHSLCLCVLASCLCNTHAAKCSKMQQQHHRRRRRQAASSKQQAASSKQQAASSKQQAASSKQQAASSKQQAASSKQQAASSKQQAASSKQQAASSRSDGSVNPSLLRLRCNQFSFSAALPPCCLSPRPCSRDRHIQSTIATATAASLTHHSPPPPLPQLS